MGPCVDVDVQTLSGGENVLILSPSPGDETLWCSGLIAESCRRGRPPYMMILTDGLSERTSDEDRQQRMAEEKIEAVRSAAAILGLAPDRLLFAGLFAGTIPTRGPAFQAIVDALTLVSWREDCNAICIACGRGTNDVLAMIEMAEAVARSQGLLLFRGSAPTATDVSRLQIGPRGPRLVPGGDVPCHCEYYVTLGDWRPSRQEKAGDEPRPIPVR